MVLPSGAKSLLLQPPAAHELIAAVVNDVPMPLRREPGISGAATVDLHSDTWPQWVQVIYRGVLATADDTSGRWEFHAPRIAGVPIEQTRWQIFGPASLQLLPGQVRVAPSEEALAPCEALVEIVQGAPDAPATWLALWRRHWDREKEIIRKRPPTAPFAPIIAARLQELENKVPDQLDAPPDENQSAPPGNVLETFTEVTARPLYELRTSSPGELASLTVTRPATAPANNILWQWLLAGGLLIVAALITQFACSASLRDWVITYPQLVLALFGCVALAIPGYLLVGVLLLACSLLATLHSPWRQRA
jgi:hypothetical protein